MDSIIPGTTAPYMPPDRFSGRFTLCPKHPSAPVQSRFTAWLRKERQWPVTRWLWGKFLAAFTRHPAQTSETYVQHLWFTVKTSLRMAALGLLLFIHGVFPFLFTRTVSSHIERLYLMMRSRIPKTRRESIDSEYEI